MPGSNRRSVAVIVLLAASLSDAQKQAPAALFRDPSSFWTPWSPSSGPRCCLPSTLLPSSLSAIAQTLVWKSDYDAFLEMKKQGKTPADSLPRSSTVSPTAQPIGRSPPSTTVTPAQPTTSALFVTTPPLRNPSARRCRISTRKARLHPATGCEDHVVSRAFAKLRARVYSTGHNCIRVSAASAHERPMCSAPINDI
jgi:hypothetical protein